MYREIYHRPFNLLAFYDLRVPSVSTASVQDTPDSTSSLYLTQMLPISLPFQPFSYQMKKTNTNSIYWNVSYRSQDIHSITISGIKDKDKSKKELPHFSNHIYLHYPPNVYVWQSWLVKSTLAKTIFALFFSYFIFFYSSVPDILWLLNSCTVFALFSLYFIFLSHLSLLQTDLASFFGLNPTVPGFSPNLQSGSLNFSRFAKINLSFRSKNDLSILI